MSQTRDSLFMSESIKINDDKKQPSFRLLILRRISPEALQFAKKYFIIKQMAYGMFFPPQGIWDTTAQP